ncbi:hypothetical protein [Shewanella insulae]|uniref:hypothetical protein n=1 Tax=Shewanella insulae TaxID=2681496 RepID=UPI0024812D26|nr:hypothetical protein [Shewanella insulae]
MRTNKMLGTTENLVFKEKLADLFEEVKTSLIDEGEKSFAKQLDTCEIQSCSSFVSDNSAFSIEFVGYNSKEIEDTFPTGNAEYTVMITYSTKNKVIGLEVIGCENTKLQQQLLAICT